MREVNRAFVELLGIPKTGLVGKPLVLYIHPDERENFHLNLDRITSGQKKPNENIEWETRVKSRNGTSFPATMTVARIRNRQGEETGLRWLVHDLTVSKIAARRKLLLTKTQAKHRETKEANRLLHALIETMPIGVIIADSDGTIAVVNTAGREILGSSVSGSVEYPNHSFTVYSMNGTLLAPEDLPLARVMKEGRPTQNVEFIVRREDGEERAILSGAAPILDESNQVVSGITVFQDITERRRSRQALRDHAYRLQVLRSANDAILTSASFDELVESVLPYSHQLLPCQLASLVVFDMQKGDGVLYNSHADNQTRVKMRQRIAIDKGWPLEELKRGELQITKDITNLVHKPAMFEAVQETGIRSMVSAPLVSNNQLLGTLIFGFAESLNLTADHLDTILQMSGKLALGVLQIRQREELHHHATHLERMVDERTAALRDSEERFRTILHASPFGIALLDTEGKIVVTNPTFRTLTGLATGELTGMSFGRFIDLSDKKVDREIYENLVAGKLTKYQDENRYVSREGDIRWHQITISPIKLPPGEKRWMAVAIMEDITDKKKIQEALARTEKLTMAGRLGASLAHEINNPLQAIIGCLGLADEMLDKDDDVKQYLDIAMQELERTAGIVSQLRDMSRQPGLLIKRTADLNEIVEKSLLLTRKRCQNESIVVNWDPDDELPPIPVAKDRIQQVLLNLILNAIEAMEGGGQLDISTTRTSQPEGVRITVADNGIGIEPDRLSRIFEPFNSNRTEGLGLGLFISRRIITEDHGGHIDVESQVGQGSTFTVFLPVDFESNE
jgi:PAS domain S-box-containing protein